MNQKLINTINKHGPQNPKLKIVIHFLAITLLFAAGYGLLFLLNAHLVTAILIVGWTFLFPIVSLPLTIRAWKEYKN
ncbi:hypothetical protein MK805_01200 [Shimazuella sp. AN120528]|uniref:hypothetical protein n=1 Tax=Shimazuella soli TaxID=1892854 RepID=UPI001F0D2535|nr:hypothetical protein [Shimazuella soli]MCH5583587.1 hypothetical protein [Shimazuella soli]